VSGRQAGPSLQNRPVSVLLQCAWAPAAQYSRLVPNHSLAVISFGPYTLDLAAAQLRRGGNPVALRPKAFDLLCALARRPGELVTKDELLDAVWGRRFISEGVIKSVVSELRQALQVDALSPAWIETVPRRGYRFSGELGPPGQPKASARPLVSLLMTSVLAAPSSAGGPAAAAAAAPAHIPGNLPAAPAPLIGREAEMKALEEQLATHRMVTMAGPSGVGKTRLALAWAAQHRRSWPDGLWLLELAPRNADTTDAAALCTALAQTLGLGAAAGVNLPALAAALEPMRLMLVLDNAEHLLAPLAPLLSALLAQTPGLRVLVTSQEPLHIAQEQVFRLSPLAVPGPADDADVQRLMASGAVQLFLARAAARLPGLALAPKQQGTVAAICRALDGLPLALELAAARVPVLGIHGIYELLVHSDREQPDTRLRWLGQGGRDAAARHHTLRDALMWSHALLDEPQQRVFRRLGVFRGGFTLAAAQAVCADPTLDGWGVLEAVDSLVDKSLVVADASLPANGSRRFQLLETPRSFALDCLTEAGEAEPIRRRHAMAIGGALALAQAEAFELPSLLWLDKHVLELSNLRAALHWTLHDRDWPQAAETALVLVVNATSLWARAGLVAEGRVACEAVRAQAGITVNPALQRGFALTLATLSVYGFAYPPETVLPAVADLPLSFLQLGDPKSAYLALSLIHGLKVRLSASVDHSEVLERMLAIEQAEWSEFFKRLRRLTQLHILRHKGPATDFLRACREELIALRRLGGTAESWSVAQYLMLAESDVGNTEAALEAGRGALAEIRAQGRLRLHGHLFAIWTGQLAEHGRPQDTRQALAELLPILRSMGTPWMAHRPWAWLAAREGRPATSARLLGWMLAAQSSPGAATPGPTVVRSTEALQARLLEELGAPALAAALAEGATLGDAAAWPQAMAYAE